MPNGENAAAATEPSVSLVGGDPTVRHARQLMLRSEQYDVRAYATREALLADPRSRDCDCIVLDLEMTSVDGLDLLRKLRANNWGGKALVLCAVAPDGPLLREVAHDGDTVLNHDVGDQTLLTAIAALVDRASRSGDSLTRAPLPKASLAPGF